MTETQIEWSLTDTARARIRDRHGVDFDPDRFTAEPLGLDGLRLWTDTDGHGLLVREDVGTGWARNTVVSAYSADMVEYRRLHDTRPFKPMPIGKSADVTPPKKPKVDQEFRLGRLDRAVLEFLASQGTPLKCAAIIEGTCVPKVLISKVIHRMHKAGLIERVSKTAKTWQPTAQGAEAIGVTPPPSPEPATPPPPSVDTGITLRYLAECTKPRDSTKIAKATGQSMDDVARAINTLARKGLIERVSKKHRTWQCTPEGREKVTR